MMIVVVRQHVAAGTEWTPTNPRLIQFVNNSRRLFFGFRRNHPIDRAADTQTRQLRESLPALSAHADSRGDLFQRAVAFLELFYFFDHRFCSSYLCVSVPLW